MPADRPDPKDRLVSEPVTPVAGSFNAAAMASGEPGVPMAFSWRGTDYRVARVIETRKNLRGCHSGSGEKYVNKHFFTVETTSGEIMTLYRTRTGSKKDSWVLYTIESARATDGARTDESPATRKPLRIAVLVSGGGTNLQALIDAEREDGGHGDAGAGRGADARNDASADDYEIACVIADRECFATERAKKAGIPYEMALAPEGIPRAEARKIISDRVLAIAKEHGADALVLAGFLTIMGGAVIDEYSGRIVNLHPALLPKFGGKGMWGHHVHEAVLASGDAESGCTIHLVDSGCDTGAILLQKRVPVLPGDTAKTLAERISSREHEAIVEGVRLLAKRLSPPRAGD